MVYCVANDDTVNVSLMASNVPNDSYVAPEAVDQSTIAYCIHVDPIRPERWSNSMVLSPVVFRFSSKSFHRDRDVDDDGCNENCNGNYIADSVIR